MQIQAEGFERLNFMRLQCYQNFFSKFQRPLIVISNYSSTKKSTSKVLFMTCLFKLSSIEFQGYFFHPVYKPSSSELAE